MGRSRLLGVLVTFRRPRELAASIERLAEQTRPLDRLVVVDNGSDPAVAALLAASPLGALGTYVDPGDNIGPAGAIAMGMRRHLADGASDDDWIVLFDDDDPPPSAQTLESLAAFAEAQRRVDDRFAAVGLAGARLDLRTGRVLRIADDELHGPVVVDHIGGGQVPLYRVEALRSVGPARDDLFFGFDDLELGLRLTRAGFRLVIDGDQWLARRHELGRVDLRVRPRLGMQEPTWRRYYSIRNLIVILRLAGARRAAARVTFESALAKPLANLVRHPRRASRAMLLGVRAARDGWSDRLGRRVDPAATQ